MKTNERQTSAKKKLIPAVAMLTASAVMLTTATYAWFTMNKNAKVTGLNMTATAGGSIEISLGELEGSLPKDGAISAPTMNNISWKNVIDVSDYYSQINKIKPASSIDGNNLFFVDDANVFAGGTAVNDKTKITQTTTDNEVNLKVRESNDATGLETLENASSADYRYIDIPVWIRTTKQDDQKVKCDVIITDPDDESPVKGSELTKAVRVAVIPLGTDTDATDTVAAPTITKAASYTDNGTISEFSLNQETYSNKAIASVKTDVTGTADTYEKHLAAVTYDHTNALAEPNTSDPDTATSKAIFTLKGIAGDNQYSVQAFVVRVWLEGESTSCKDANASQDWNIQLNFTGDNA